MFGSQHCVTAVVMVLCLVILLCTVYVQQQPYRYIQTSGALRKSLHLDVAERVKTIEDIFDWYRSLGDQLAHDTYKDVIANCQLTVGKNKITVDGKDYIEVGSDIYDTACKDASYVKDKGDKKTLYITGDNEVLSFGFFMKRSFPLMSEKHASKTRVEVRSTKLEASNAMNDPRMVDTCSSKYGMCLLSDAFQNSSASTLNWEGRKMDGKLMFKNGSSAYLHIAQSKRSPILTPCYPYYYDSANDTYVALPEHRIFDPSLDKAPECTVKWFTRGEDAREHCLLASKDLTYRDSFAAAYTGSPSVSYLYDAYFMCSKLKKMSTSAMANVYVESDDTIRVYLKHEKMYGNFYDTSSEYDWIGETIALTDLLYAHSFIDKNTRVVKTYIISRNLADHALFYNIVIVEFYLHTTGMITTDTTITFIPIVQYYYGMQGYPWRNKILYVFEVLMVVVFALLVIKVAARCVYVVRSVKSEVRYLRRPSFKLKRRPLPPPPPPPPSLSHTARFPEVEMSNRSLAHMAENTLKVAEDEEPLSPDLELGYGRGQHIDERDSSDTVEMSRHPTTDVNGSVVVADDGNISAGHIDNSEEFHVAAVIQSDINGYIDDHSSSDTTGHCCNGAKPSPDIGDAPIHGDCEVYEVEAKIEPNIANGVLDAFSLYNGGDYKHVQTVDDHGNADDMCCTNSASDDDGASAGDAAAAGDDAYDAAAAGDDAYDDGDGACDDGSDEDGSVEDVLQLPSFRSITLRKNSSVLSKRDVTAAADTPPDVDVLPPIRRRSLRKNPSVNSQSQIGSQMTFRSSTDSAFDLDQLPNTSPSLKKSKSALSDNSYARQVSFVNPFSKTTPATRKITIYTVQGLTIAFLLDILGVIALSVAIVTRVSFVKHCRDAHNYILHHEGKWNAALENIIQDFMMLRDEVLTIKLVITMCVLLAVMQLFSHLSYSRRLGIVTGTIGRSLHDLVPVIIIFITLLVAYAILGTNIYGDRLPQWSNIYSSMITLFIMILGEYGIYDDMRQVSPVETVVFFWSYVCIIFFIVFNIALAVILELYSDLRKDNIEHYKMKKAMKRAATHSSPVMMRSPRSLPLLQKKNN